MKLEEIHQIAVLGAGLMGHGVEETIRKRDQEFLQRLKNLYRESETGK